MPVGGALWSIVDVALTTAARTTMSRPCWLVLALVSLSCDGSPVKSFVKGLLSGTDLVPAQAPPPQPIRSDAALSRFVPRGCLASAPAAAAGATYWVRPDGGTAAQCTGKADAPYAGTGTAQPCAWNHPFQALPPQGAPRIAGGDTLVIGSGQYRMGAGAPGAEGCQGVDAYECAMPALPSGPSPAQPTRVVGLLSSTGAMPQLWGAERPWQIVDLRGSDNVVLECLEITDHSPCVEFHSGSRACSRDQAPYGDWAQTGISAKDSENVVLRSIDVHGLATHGIVGGRLRDWLLEDVRIAANGWVGWNGDLGDEPAANSGTLTFRRVTIEWNGCGEEQGRPVGCWAQNAGGYGDGLGTARTGGTWVFEDVRVLHNTSDGIDLLYLDASGKALFDRVWAAGNAGNQLKARGEATARNVVAIGTCRFFHGQPFTHEVDDCRAGGNALAFEPVPGRPISVLNTSVYNEGVAALELVVPAFDASDAMRSSETGASPCGRLTPVVLRNDVWVGGPRYDGEQSSLFYVECLGQEGQGATVDHQFGVVWGMRDYGFGPEGPCPPGSNNLCADPLLDRATMRVGPGSPAIGTGLAGPLAPPVDLAGTPRPQGAGIDRGAFEQ